MVLGIKDWEKEKRILMEVALEPLQGGRFQPTGFPNLGPATYFLPDGTEMLLVESPQSMANRLEAVCWDQVKDDLVPALEGLPYVRVLDGKTGTFLTASLLEAHRLNSPYIIESDDSSFLELLKKETGSMENFPVDIPGLARLVFKYDPNSVLHGLFFAKKDLAGGRLRLQRLLSSFIEARGIRPVESGGAKIDRVNPSATAEEVATGFGNVPFSRTEFTAAEIKAYFNLDLLTLRSYNLEPEMNELLLMFSLWKVRRFLEGGLRLRTACDLACKNLVIKQPGDLDIPSAEELEKELKNSIQTCREKGHFASPPVTVVTWIKKKKQKGAQSEGEAVSGDEGEEE